MYENGKIHNKQNFSGIYEEKTVLVFQAMALPALPMPIYPQPKGKVNNVNNIVGLTMKRSPEILNASSGDPPNVQDNRTSVFNIRCFSANSQEKERSMSHQRKRQNPIHSPSATNASFTDNIS